LNRNAARRIHILALATSGRSGFRTDRAAAPCYRGAMAGYGQFCVVARAFPGWFRRCLLADIAPAEPRA